MASGAGGSADANPTIRRAPGERVFIIVATAVGLSALVLVANGFGWAWWNVAYFGVVAVLGTWFCFRWCTTSARMGADQLIVRNLWRTRRVGRGQISRFEIGRAGFGLSQLPAIRVLTSGGASIPLDVTAAVPIPRRLPAARDVQLEALTRWAQGR